MKVRITGEKLFSLTETASLLKADRDTLITLAREYDVPRWKVGKAVAFDAPGLDLLRSLLARHRAKSFP